MKSCHDNIPEALKWFETNYNIDFKDSSLGSNSKEVKRLSELILKCKEHSKTVKWSNIDVNRLALTVKKYKNDILTDIRLNKINRKLNEKS